MNNRKFITKGKNIPTTKSPISQAVVSGNYCHVSGQLSFGLNGEFIDGTVLEQAEIAFKNLFAILEKAEFRREEIVFIDIAFTNLEDLEIVTPFYDSLFKKDRKPSRTIYQVAALPAGGKIKVMAIAIK